MKNNKDSNYSITKEKKDTNCNWCNKKSEYEIHNKKADWKDHACKEHKNKWF